MSVVNIDKASTMKDSRYTASSHLVPREAGVVVGSR